MTLYGIINLKWILPATAAVIVLYLIYSYIKKRSLSKTEAVICVVCVLLAGAIFGISLPIEELYVGIMPASAAVLFSYLMYILYIKKRSLTKTEAIIWAGCILSACAISMVMILSR